MRQAIDFASRDNPGLESDEFPSFVVGRASFQTAVDSTSPRTCHLGMHPGVFQINPPVATVPGDRFRLIGMDDGLHAEEGEGGSFIINIAS